MILLLDSFGFPAPRPLSKPLYMTLLSSANERQTLHPVNVPSTSQPPLDDRIYSVVCSLSGLIRDSKGPD